VAASCAAVLVVYAAGYWRTRDVARQMQAQTRERRPPRPAAQVVAAPAPTGVVLPVPEQVSVPASIPTPAAASVPVPEVKPAKQVSAEPVDSAPQIQAEPPVAPAVASIQPSSPDNLPTPATAPAPGPLPEGFQGWRDGTYTGRGTSYHGDIEVEVVIQAGRIVKSGISGCYTRYSCGVIEHIINQPVERQSPNVDQVSRATESADAYYYAVLEALTNAEPPTETAQTPK
jgi:uncharacterized protein with FMN-binding domain